MKTRRHFLDGLSKAITVVWFAIFELIDNSVEWGKANNVRVGWDESSLWVGDDGNGMIHELYKRNASNLGNDQDALMVAGNVNNAGQGIWTSTIGQGALGPHAFLISVYEKAHYRAAFIAIVLDVLGPKLRCMH